MTFNSPAFLLLVLPICLMCIFNAKGQKARLWVIIVLSLAYYYMLESKSIYILAAVILVNIGNLFLMQKNWFMWRSVGRAFGVSVNLLPIVYFKVSGNPVEPELAKNVLLNDVWVPLGISFYSFQLVAFYVYRSYEELEGGFAAFVAYVCYFPQLVLGPIMRYSELVPQLLVGKINSRNTVEGLFLIAVACAKKNVLVVPYWDLISSYSEMLANGGELSFFGAWCYVLANTIYIYLDYSAYADFAVGIALFMGVRLIAGFPAPFKSNSVGQFWRKWNVTLMRFFRDCIYKPLGQALGGGKVAGVVGVFGVMLACGLWHGFGWGFVCWGVLVALCIVLERTAVMSGVLSKLPVPVRRVYVLLAFMLPLVFFINTDLGGAVRLLSEMLGRDGLSFPAKIHYVMVSYLPVLESVLAVSADGYPLQWREASWLALGAIGILFGPTVQEVRDRFLGPYSDGASVGRYALWGAGGLVCLVVISLSLNVMSPAATFFYFQF